MGRRASILKSWRFWQDLEPLGKLWRVDHIDQKQVEQVLDSDDTVSGGRTGMALSSNGRTLESSSLNPSTKIAMIGAVNESDDGQHTAQVRRLRDELQRFVRRRKERPQPCSS